MQDNPSYKRDPLLVRNPDAAATATEDDFKEYETYVENHFSHMDDLPFGQDGWGEPLDENGALYMRTQLWNLQKWGRTEAYTNFRLRYARRIHQAINVRPMYYGIGFGWDVISAYKEVGEPKDIMGLMRSLKGQLSKYEANDLAVYVIERTSEDERKKALGVTGLDEIVAAYRHPSEFGGI
jgi:hypothetical protein